MRKQLQPMWILLPLMVIVLAACQIDTVEATASPIVANKAVVREFVEVMNSKDFNRLDELLVAGFVRHSQATPDFQVRSREEFKQFALQDAATFPDNRVTLDLIVAEGDMVAFYATYKGTQKGQMGPFPPSGEQLELEFSGVFRLEGGKIAELWVTWDNIAALTQLGHFPLAPSPVAVIEALEAAVNAEDLDALEALFAEDGVEYDGSGTYEGAERIRDSYVPIVSVGSVDHANIRMEGDKVIYDFYLLNAYGQVTLGQKYEAVIENGKIKSNIYVGEIPIWAVAGKTEFSGFSYFEETLDEGDAEETDDYLAGQGLTLLYDDDMSDPRISGDETVVVNYHFSLMPEPVYVTGPMWGTSRIENEGGSWDVVWTGVRDERGFAYIHGMALGQGGYEGMKAHYTGKREDPDETLPFEYVGYIIEPDGH
jgi:predicted ester cyclase